MRLIIKNLKMSFVFNKSVAFTLAEVLITLGIIGIVAALTIPALMNNIKDYQLKQAWKKEYAVMAQSVSRMTQENGGSLKGLFTNNAVARDNFKQYLNYSRECANGASFGDCWASGYKELGGNNGGWGNTAGLILNDGASVMFESNNGAWVNCSYAVTAQLLICGYAPVDVNGPAKGPNVIGRDIFDFWILENRILPEGCMQDGRSSSCSPSLSGAGCSGVYLYQ